MQSVNHGTAPARFLLRKMRSDLMSDEIPSSCNDPWSCLSHGLSFQYKRGLGALSCKIEIFRLAWALLLGCWM